MSGKELDELKEKQTSLIEGSTHNDTTGNSNSEAPSKLAEEEALPELDDCYEICGVVGRGGMGCVYKVYQKSIGKTLAIKVLQPTLACDPVALKRFEQEVDSASKLSHSNLAAVYGHGKTKSGAPYLVMDFLDGENLSSFLKREGTLSSNRALAIFIQIASALAHAHENGVIHRDVKPTNVIITTTADGAAKAHIVDFGIAKVMPTANRETHDLTETGEVFGSPNYMSPEQCLGFMLDERSDIYSLGCLMYEVLIGKPPFGGANPIQVVVKHINEEAPAFAEQFKGNTMGARLEDVVMKCLEKDKSQRYQSVNDLIKDLNLIATGKAPPKYVKQKEPKKELTRRGTIGLVVGVILVLGYFSTIFGMTGNQDLVSKVMLWMGTLLVGGGAYSFIMLFLERFRRSVLETHHKKLVASTSHGLARLRLFVHPPILVGTIATTLNQQLPTLPVWVQSLVTWCAVAHGLSMLVAANSAVGCLLFRRNSKRSGLNIFAEFIAVSASMFFLTFYVAPEGTAKVAYALSKAAGYYADPIRTGLLSAAAYLEKENSQPAVEYANHLIVHQKYNEAIDVLTRAMEHVQPPYVGPNNNFTKSDLLRRRAEIYLSNLNNLAKFYEDMAASINLDPTGMSLKRRATQYEQEGKYKEAIADLTKASRKAYDNDIYMNRARLWFAIGQCQNVVNDTTAYLTRFATDYGSRPPNPSALFLRAKAYEMLDLRPQAMADYQSITEITYGIRQPSNLVRAYAYNQLNDMKLFEQYLKLAESQDHQTKDDLKNHLGIPGKFLPPLNWR